MAMAVHHHQMDIAPAEGTSPAAATGAAVRQRRWWLRRMYSPVGVAEREQGAVTAAVDAAADDDGGVARKPRRGGWLRRLVPREHALRRRWKLLSGAPSRLAAGLPRWKRMPRRLSVGGGCASALLDAAAFRVMYVVEAVVLGLALSCFFCCCGCQI
ncbi:hypothetical protein SETIT_5G261800v2 [Setaria italica]|uniref:Uncharacterized protein n=2 Tax=Setaria italica TaxID=4555 RepID=A0A368R8V9_SETIT|nr:uncharacterized protein LOC101780959 [Setaria italica]RCV26635.1 hypothetical protein SETIT_5G261800v2 [Setaria italica]